MELTFLIITFIFFSILAAVVLLINNYVLTKINAKKSLEYCVSSGMHSLIFNESYKNKDQDTVFNDLLKNMNYQISSNDEPFEIADIIKDEKENVATFTVLKTYKWIGIKKYIQDVFSTDLDTIGLGSEIEECIKEEITEEIKTIKFIVDHKLYSESQLLVGETIDLPTTPLKPKYNFVGWYIDGDLDKDIISEEEWRSLRIADDMTFVAQFKAKY